jgi:hypothetical protein
MSRAWSALRLTACALMLLLSGCAVSPDRLSSGTDLMSVEKHGVAGWWYARFRINHDKADVQWHLDALLANELIAPILKQHAGEISLWRFHRRAANDHAGHQFSFIYYASPETATVINRELRQNKLYSELRQHGFLQELLLDSPDGVLRPELAATSDSKWSKPLQESWPHYIMGVSKIWLGLIQQYSAAEKHPGSLSGLVDKYRQVNRRVSAVWRKQGRHALLHHLNALFGYQPLEMSKQRLINF